MKKTIASLLIVIAVAGCSKQEDSPAAAGGGGGGSSSNSTSEITYKTSDGWIIHGDFYQATGGTGAVILLHQRGGSASDWRPLVFKLNGAKLSALAIDQRGAGRSTGKQNDQDAPWETSEDIAGAIAWLKGKGISADHIGLAGASYGANNAMIYAARKGGVKAIALLSPGKDYHGLTVPAGLAKFKGGILVLTAGNDSIQGGGPQAIKSVAPEAEMKTFAGDAHGTNLFRAHPDSIDAIGSFFKGRI
jgi:pimeloyl-ACP methyl ester carboxylesterase